MKEISYFNKIYIASNFVDFRKQMRGLTALVRGVMDLDPLVDSKNLYVFCNKDRSSLKLLYWDRTGFACGIKS